MLYPAHNHAADNELPSKSIRKRFSSRAAYSESLLACTEYKLVYSVAKSGPLKLRAQVLVELL